MRQQNSAAAELKMQLEKVGTGFKLDQEGCSMHPRESDRLRPGASVWVWVVQLGKELVCERTLSVVAADGPVRRYPYVSTLQMS